MILIKLLKLPSTQQGFTYLATMVTIAIMGIALSVTGYQWKTMAKREKEKELLFRGNEIRSAIAQYVNIDPLKRYPHSLDDLVKDPRSSKSVRYLRKLYKDPITNDDWALVVDPVKGLLGVHSKSKDEPLKTANFRAQDHCFEGKTHYREWIFVVQPFNPGLNPANPLLQNPTGGTGAPAAVATGTSAIPCPSTPASPDEEK